ncbi:MAG: hypothetical protein R3D51_10275 [Hyphomicrobiaceae bacterium]
MGAAFLRQTLTIVPEIDMFATAYRNALFAENNLTWGQAFLLAVPASAIMSVGIAALYLTKSALGINLMPGPSPLHDLLYWMLV